MIKAIETVYKGYRMRSRLEARWGIFLDVLGIEWEYEREGFTLQDGRGYLPDFWLPSFGGGMYAEVKPAGGDFTIALQFSREAQVTMWLCEGLPDFQIYKVQSGDGCDWEGIPLVSQASDENRMYSCPGDGEFASPLDYGAHYMMAVAAARGARFEHGEHGAML